MRITELFTAQSIALDEALTDQEQIISRLVELQATHGNITDKEAYKKALYAREAEGSTYVDNGITVPHAKTNVVTRPSLAALRLSSPVQYNAEDDGTTDLLFAIAAPENGSLHVDMLARMMQMLMNEDFVEKLKAAKTPAEFLDCIDAQEEAQFGAESFTQQEIPQSGYRILAVTACVNGIAHTYMAAEALTKAGDKLGLPTKVETNGSDGAKNILTREEIANCDGIIVAAEKKVETARFDGKPVLFTRVDDGIHKPEELIKKIEALKPIENLTNEENILLPTYPRICSAFGFYQKQQKYILEDNFLGLDRRDIELLNPETEAWKIGIYRYKLFHPRVLILKNMLQNLNVREVAWLKRELREIVGRGSSVLLLENESKVCVDVADRLEVIA